jgi:hypothetical protein
MVSSGSGFLSRTQLAPVLGGTQLSELTSSVNFPSLSPTEEENVERNLRVSYPNLTGIVCVWVWVSERERKVSKLSVKVVFPPRSIGQSVCL